MEMANLGVSFGHHGAVFGDDKSRQAIPVPGAGLVSSVFSFSDKSVWVVSRKGFIAHWNRKRWTNEAHSKLGNSTTIWGCNENDLWVSDFGGTLLHWNGKKWRENRPFGQANIWSIHGNACDQLWATESTDRGFDGYKSENSRLWRWNGTTWVKTGEVPGLSRVFATPQTLWIYNSSTILRLPLP